MRPFSADISMSSTQNYQKRPAGKARRGAPWMIGRKAWTVEKLRRFVPRVRSMKKNGKRRLDDIVTNFVQTRARARVGGRAQYYFFRKKDSSLEQFLESLGYASSSSVPILNRAMSSGYSAAYLSPAPIRSVPPNIFEAGGPNASSDEQEDPSLVPTMNYAMLDYPIAFQYQNEQSSTEAQMIASPSSVPTRNRASSGYSAAYLSPAPIRSVPPASMFEACGPNTSSNEEDRSLVPTMNYAMLDYPIAYQYQNEQSSTGAQVIVSPSSVPTRSHVRSDYSVVCLSPTPIRSVPPSMFEVGPSTPSAEEGPSFVPTMYNQNEQSCLRALVMSSPSSVPTTNNRRPGYPVYLSPTPIRYIPPNMFEEGVPAMNCARSIAYQSATPLSRGSVPGNMF